MSNFASLDGPFYKFMSRLLDMLKLNFLWILCSLPIVTMGAATTAAYSITLRMVDEEEGYIAKPFFKAFKENLFKGSIIGIIQMVAIYAIWIDFQFYGLQKNIGFLVVGILAIYFTFMHTIFAFPLQARYENSIINTLRNSYSIMAKFFLRTIFLFVILAIECVVILWNSTTVFLGILIGPGCIMLTISGFAMYAFRRVESEAKN